MKGWLQYYFYGISSSKLMVIAPPSEMSTVAFTLFHALFPFVPISRIPERDILLSGLS
jgi:hypothetical protein